jgi:hypothetical protein
MCDDDWCLIHGYGFMRKHSIFDHFAYCSECERISDVREGRKRLTEGELVSLEEFKKEVLS